MAQPIQQKGDVLFLAHRVSRCSTITSEPLYEFGVYKVCLLIQTRVELRCTIQVEGQKNDGVVRTMTHNSCYIKKGLSKQTRSEEDDIRSQRQKTEGVIKEEVVS